MKTYYIDTDARNERLHALSGYEAIRIVDNIGAGMEVVLYALNQTGYSSTARHIWEAIPNSEETKREMALDWVWYRAMNGHLEELGWGDLIHEDEDEEEVC